MSLGITDRNRFFALFLFVAAAMNPSRVESHRSRLFPWYSRSMFASINSQKIQKYRISQFVAILPTDSDSISFDRSCHIYLARVAAAISVPANLIQPIRNSCIARSFQRHALTTLDDFGSALMLRVIINASFWFKLPALTCRYIRPSIKRARTHASASERN